MSDNDNVLDGAIVARKVVQLLGQLGSGIVVSAEMEARPGELFAWQGELSLADGRLILVAVVEHAPR